MPRPDTEGRYEILRLQLASKNVAPDVDLLQLARDLPGLVGADLANIVNEAQLNGACGRGPCRLKGLGQQHARLACVLALLHTAHTSVHTLATVRRCWQQPCCV
jgi:hypothetical protein